MRSHTREMKAGGLFARAGCSCWWDRVLAAFVFESHQLGPVGLPIEWLDGWLAGLAGWLASWFWRTQVRTPVVQICVVGQTAGAAGVALRSLSSDNSHNKYEKSIPSPDVQTFSANIQRRTMTINCPPNNQHLTAGSNQPFSEPAVRLFPLVAPCCLCDFQISEAGVERGEKRDSREETKRREKRGAKRQETRDIR